MVARADTSRLIPSPSRPTVAAVAGTGAGMLVAIACLAGPTDLLETFVVRSGLASLVNAAAPPLGMTARGLLAAGGGALVAAVVWAIVVLVAGERRLSLAVPRVRARVPVAPVKRLPGTPSVRRGDSHPDAPPRPPILAERDLGAPFLSIVAPAAEQSPAPAPASTIEEDEIVSIVVERALPADLDTALAAVDPAAIPSEPRQPVRPVAPLASPLTARPAAPQTSFAPPLAPGERIDSIELGPDVRDQPDTIEALLARLERGARRRTAPVDARARNGESASPAQAPDRVLERERRAGGSLEETLGSLRRLATGN